MVNSKNKYYHLIGKPIFKHQYSDDSDDKSSETYQPSRANRSYHAKPSANSRYDGYAHLSHSGRTTSLEVKSRTPSPICEKKIKKNDFKEWTDVSTKYYGSTRLEDRSRSPSLINFSVCSPTIERRPTSFHRDPLEEPRLKYNEIYSQQKLPRILPSPTVPKPVATDINDINFPRLNKSPTHSPTSSKFHAIPPPSADPPEDLFLSHLTGQDSPSKMQTFNSYVPPLSPILYDLDEPDDAALFDSIPLNDIDWYNDFYRTPVRNTSLQSFRDYSSYSNNFSPYFFSPQPQSHGMGGASNDYPYLLAQNEIWGISQRPEFTGFPKSVSSPISISPPRTTEHSLALSATETSSPVNVLVSDNLPLIPMRNNVNQPTRYPQDRVRRNLQLEDDEDDEEWC